MLRPTTSVPPGLSAYASRVLTSKTSTNFAYITPQSIVLRTAKKSENPSQPLSSYPITGLFGELQSAAMHTDPAAKATVLAMDYNETFLAAIVEVDCPQRGERRTSLRVWSIADGADESKIRAQAASLSEKFFKTEGTPTSLTVAGKHHIIIGTSMGRLISLNTSHENNEPRVVTLPPPAAGGAAQPVVLDVVGSKSRSELIACGCADGVAAILLLSASTGLRVKASLQPFPSSNHTRLPSFPAAGHLAVSTLAFSPFNDNYLAMGSNQGGALALFSVDSNALVQTFAYPALDVSGLAWSPTEQGSFYAASSLHDYIMRFTSNSKNEVERIAPGTESNTTGIERGEKSPDEPSPSPTTAVFRKGGARLNGIRGMAALDGPALALALQDGSCAVFHLGKQQTALRTTAHHTRHVLCAAMSQHDPSLYLTGSVDGSVCCWSTQLPHDPLWRVTMSSTARSPAAGRIGAAGVLAVTAVQYGSSGKYIYVGLQNGEVLAWSTSSLTLAWRVSILAGRPIRSLRCISASGDPSPNSTPVASATGVSTSSSSSLLLAAGEGGICLLSARDGSIKRHVLVPFRITCLEVEPTHSKAMVLGGSDHTVYIYGVPSATDPAPGTVQQPLLTLVGHTAAITAVAFSPVAPTCLASCSADGTCRVWDISANDASVISAQSRVLSLPSSATGSAPPAMRSLAWCGALTPYLLLTSTADGAVQLWDVRLQTDGSAPQMLSQVRCSTASMVRVLTHSDRPARAVSVAADGGLTYWSLEMVRQAALDAALGSIEHRLALTASMDAAGIMRAAVVPEGATASSLLFGGTPSVQTLLTELRSCTKPVERLEKILTFFDDGTLGMTDLQRQAVLAMNPASLSLNLAETLQRSILFPSPAQLVEAHRAQAHAELERLRGKKATQHYTVDQRRQLLRQAADQCWKCGLMEEAVKVWGEANDWETALAVAPLLGREYWLQLCVQAATAMEMEGSLTKAATYWIAAGDSGRASQLLARAPQSPLVDLPLAVVKACPQKPATAGPASAAAALPPDYTIDANAAGALGQALSEDSRQAVHRLCSPTLEAALLLMEKKNDDAIRLLAESGEVLVTHLLLHSVPVQDQRSIDIAYLMNLKQCCRHQQWETALMCGAAMTQRYDGYGYTVAAFQDALQTQLLRSGVPPAELAARSEKPLRTFVERVKYDCSQRQLSLDVNVIQQQGAADGSASQNHLAALVILAEANTGPFTSAPLTQSYAGFLENLLNIVLQDVDGENATFYLLQAFRVCGYVSLPPPNSAPAGAPMNPVAAWGTEHRSFLALSLLISSLLCVKVYRFPQLIRFALTKASEFAQGLPNVEALLGRVHPTLSSYSPASKELRCTPAGSEIVVLDAHHGSPKVGARVVSCMTGEPFTGAAVAVPAAVGGSGVEANTIYMSREEAITWSLVSHLSPSMNGSRFYGA